MAALNRNYEFKEISHYWVQKISSLFKKYLWPLDYVVWVGCTTAAFLFLTIYPARQNIIWQRRNNVLTREVFSGFHLHRIEVCKFHTPNTAANVASKLYYHMTFYTKKYTQTTAQKLRPICIRWINQRFFLNFITGWATVVYISHFRAAIVRVIRGKS
jgi:hypothetical protein